jgi:hypothetical protein
MAFLSQCDAELVRSGRAAARHMTLEASGAFAPA